MIIRKQFTVRMEETHAHRSWTAEMRANGQFPRWFAEAVAICMKRINEWLRDCEYFVVSMQEDTGGTSGVYSIVVFAAGEPKPKEHGTRKIEL